MGKTSSKLLRNNSALKRNDSTLKIIDKKGKTALLQAVINNNYQEF